MKINKTLIILSLLLVFSISLGAVSATEDVDVNDIDNNYVATVESSVMNEEISTVSEGQINKSSEIYDDIKSATGIYNITTDYQIDKTWEISNANVIIEGNNHTIYGNGNQAFRITGNNVIIKNLNFVNCSANTGGAIYFYNDGSGNVSGCSFVNCNGEDGGAINREIGGSAIYVSGCSFVNCNGEDGGAIYLGNGGSVTSCSFVNCSSNSRIYGHGGAIYSYSGSVTSCSFVNCSANNSGGAIYFYNDGSVSGCSFVNCSANSGGAIDGGSVSGCSFVNCSANSGGAIYSGGSVSGCSFVNCSANNSGGAIYSGGSVGNCSFVNCSAEKGGAIYLANSGSVSGCSFVNCSANSGGAIYFKGSGSVNYCIFDNVDASVGKAIYGEYSGNYDFNFFSFKNDINFPKYLIASGNNSITPNSWVVLDVIRSGEDYIVKFVNNEGDSLNRNMPDYTARLSINGATKNILIKNNAFAGNFVPGNYLVTSPNSGNVLANRTYRIHIDIIPTALSTTYGSGKYFTVKVLDKNKKPVSGVKLTLKIYTGSKVNKTVTVTTDKNGIAKYSASKLSIGTHKVVITLSNPNYIVDSNKNSSITISKAKKSSMEDEGAVSYNNKISNSVGNMENCGTPLIALLIALISLPIIRRK